MRSHEISHRQIVTCPICSPLSVTYLFTGNTCGPRKGSGYPLPSSLSRTPQFGYTFSSSTHTHTPDHKSIQENDQIIVINKEKRVESSSHWALRPSGSQKRCAAFILHCVPVTNFPREKRSTGWFFTRRRAAGIQGVDLDTQPSASIRPQWAAVSNKARTSPKKTTTNPLRTERENLPVTDDPNFGIYIHAPTCARGQKYAYIIIIPGKLRKCRRTWSGEARFNNKKILLGATDGPLHGKQQVCYQ